MIEQRLDTIQKSRKAQLVDFSATGRLLGDTIVDSEFLTRSLRSIGDQSCTERTAKDPMKPYVSKQFWKYYEEADRMFDMFTMIDFYGRKRRCLELGHPLTKEDDKWYRDQRHRLLKRITELKRTGELDPKAWEEIAQLKKQLT